MTPATHREQLVSMLSEAAEIEHCLMCTYLYGAFSLKQSTAEDLNDQELAAVRRWRREVIAIATDEMLHLSLVSNLLIAIGARPHYRRFNFPVSPGLFPADVAIALAPLDRATLDHFVYLERPRDAEEGDAEVYEKSSYQRGVIPDRLMSFAEDYATVGELYETIDRSLELLAAEMGESGLFIGPLENQITTRDFALPGLCTVGSLAEARQAIHLIVHQGEGCPIDKQGSHYGRFCAIRQEWDTLERARPGFVPYRHSARNPLMRPPVVQGERVHVLAEPASTLLDAGNACYELMLRLLALISDDPSFHRVARRDIGAQTLALMHAIADIGSELSSLPANASHPNVGAGLSFTVSRQMLSFQSPESAAAIVAERFRLLAARCGQLTTHMPGLSRYAQSFQQYADAWRPGAARASNDRMAPVASPASAANGHSPAPAANGCAAPKTDKPNVDVAEGREVVIRFDHHRCIHARHCVLGEPAVFLANTPGEWIFPDAAPPERIAIVAHNCPSGAITWSRRDGSAAEMAPAVNTARVRENGPLAINAAIRIDGEDAGFRATLCRCGQSANKPFCDGAHATAGFVASGEPATRSSAPLATRNGPLQITPLRDGPLEVQGSLEICSGTGRTIDRTVSTRLCRCGQSRDKPFCDGSHLVAGFAADGA